MLAAAEDTYDQAFIVVCAAVKRSTHQRAIYRLCSIARILIDQNRAAIGNRVMSNISAKKRLMYISSEDFYLYCYSVFVILDFLGCRDGKYFRDYRKLAFLTDIISDDKTVYVVSHSSGKKLNPKDYERLLDSYSSGLARRSEILKLLFVLEKRGYVNLNRGKVPEIDVTLAKENLPSDFLSNKVFDSESKNIKDISKKVVRLASLTLDTMLNKIYAEKWRS
jgi:hypothetical protein